MAIKIFIQEPNNLLMLQRKLSTFLALKTIFQTESDFVVRFKDEFNLLNLSPFFKKALLKVVFLNIAQVASQT